MKPNKSSIRLTQYRIKPQSGTALTLQKGQIIRVIDVEGEQVSDLACFALRDIDEYFSSGRTIDYNEKIYLSTGDILYSNQSNPMLTILSDKVGKHDLLFAPCSQEMFVLSYGITEAHPNCLDNLTSHLDPFGITASQITNVFNIFMNATLSAHGNITIKPPLSKAGDYIDLRAHMDLIVGITACSAKKCNNYHCTSIDVEIFEAI
jgi:uncharacterized protein YcgI (DUF1989 family)